MELTNEQIRDRANMFFMDSLIQRIETLERQMKEVTETPPIKAMHAEIIQIWKSLQQPEDRPKFLDPNNPDEEKIISLCITFGAPTGYAFKRLPPTGMAIFGPPEKMHAEMLIIWYSLERRQYECDNYKYCPLPDRPKFLDPKNADEEKLIGMSKIFGAPTGFTFKCFPSGNIIFGKTECFDHSFRQHNGGESASIDQAIDQANVVVACFH
jgi:hypothetical protein